MYAILIIIYEEAKNVSFFLHTWRKKNISDIIKFFFDESKDTSLPWLHVKGVMRWQNTHRIFFCVFVNPWLLLTAA